ncbi:hypothetical protein BD779DRAFT_209774 [Infundibulicybe gibba]|nr:hypothetical protein BD779DRAFT_209774 [Infundibulicybe gibba]
MTHHIPAVPPASFAIIILRGAASSHCHIPIRPRRLLRRHGVSTMSRPCPSGCPRMLPVTLLLMSLPALHTPVASNVTAVAVCLGEFLTLFDTLGGLSRVVAHPRSSTPPTGIITRPLRYHSPVGWPHCMPLIIIVAHRPCYPPIGSVALPCNIVRNFA